MTTSIAEMIDKTDFARERYVDFLRAFSIVVVVLGHWLMAIVYFDDGGLSGESALESIPWAWGLTWVLQVMPLFFFVGGFSNSVSLDANARRGGSYGGWLASRMDRLMRPTIVFALVWLGFMGVLNLVSPGAVAQLQQAAGLIAKPLWFLAVYVLVVALAPTMLRLHRRFGLGVVVALVAGAVVTDAARFAFSEGIGWLNFAFVWLVAHHLGFFYADGSLVRWGRKVHAALTGIGLGALVLLTHVGPYSKSMVGGALPGASNNSPPSIALVAMTIWLVGLVMLARPAAARRLQQRRAWGAVIAANSIIMTLYLWHLTALLVAAVTLLPAGFPQPTGGTAAWWLLRPVWLGALALYVVPFVVAFGRFERPTVVRAQAPRSLVAASGGVALMVLGLAGLATSGFATASVGAPAPLTIGPLASAAALVSGSLVLRRRA